LEGRRLLHAREPRCQRHGGAHPTTSLAGDRERELRAAAAREVTSRMVRRAPVLGCLLVALTAPLAALPRVPEKASIELQIDRAAYAPGETGRLTAVVRIDEGWHVNSHQPTYDYLIPTSLELRLPKGWEAAQVTYPEGKLARFSFAPE